MSAWQARTGPYCSFISEPTRIGKLDLGFAIGAASRDATNALRHMKDVIKSIADAHGTDKIHYGVITYGAQASIQLPFGYKMNSAESLKSFIDSIPAPTGGPAIDKALEAARTLFGGEGVRYDAQKVLVLMVDKRSSGDEVSAMKTAIELKESGVNIITVAVGGETDHKNLKNISTTPDNVINTTSTGKPDEVGKEIVDRTGTVVKVLLRSND